MLLGKSKKNEHNSFNSLVGLPVKMLLDLIWYGFHVEVNPCWT